jgi:hypothetical protein
LTNSIISKRTFFRRYINIIKLRFHDIEILHHGLLDYNPGCLIPILPEKNFLANIYVDSSEFLNKRMKEIEDFLIYINGHKYLKRNPKYLQFISPVLII